jgi:hypothetical protein
MHSSKASATDQDPIDYTLKASPLSTGELRQLPTCSGWRNGDFDQPLSNPAQAFAQIRSACQSTHRAAILTLLPLLEQRRITCAASAHLYPGQRVNQCVVAAAPLLTLHDAVYLLTILLNGGDSDS